VSDAINKVIWDQVKTPPPEALKEIKAGRLKGKSDISPQWRYEIMTEIFGPCGIGWKFTINKLWTEQGSEGQVFAFAMVTVEYTHDDKVGSIPGIGGSLLVAKEKHGPHCNDEAFKMATTDALGTALKMLGVAADVYAGLIDSKYGAKSQERQQQPQGNQQQPANNEFGF
jgi:hypothetical protein